MSSSKLVVVIVTFFLGFAFSAASVNAAQVRFRVTDPTGAVIPKVLLILRGIDGEQQGEIARALTGTDGSIPSHDLMPGLYKVIAGFPFGVWVTQVRYFLVTTRPKMIEIHLEAMGAINVIRLDLIDFHVQVLENSGKPVSGAWVIACDSEAEGTGSSKTDSEGRATIKIAADWAEVTTLYGDKSNVQHVNIPTGSRDCQQTCIVTAMDKVRQNPHNLTIQLP